MSAERAARTCEQGQVTAMLVSWLERSFAKKVAHAASLSIPGESKDRFDETVSAVIYGENLPTLPKFKFVGNYGLTRLYNTLKPKLDKF
jgi:hypothetical protein